MVNYARPDFSSVALITIDTQRDTLDGQPLEVPGTSAALPQMQKRLQCFRRQRKPIVHIVRIYEADASNVDLCRRRAVLEGSGFLIELPSERIPRSQLVGAQRKSRGNGAAGLASEITKSHWLKMRCPVSTQEGGRK